MCNYYSPSVWHTLAWHGVWKEKICTKQTCQINKFLTVIGKNLVKTQLCEDPNGHELQLEEAKRLLHVDLVKTMARKKNLSSNLQKCNIWLQKLQFFLLHCYFYY